MAAAAGREGRPAGAPSSVRRVAPSTYLRAKSRAYRPVALRNASAEAIPHRGKANAGGKPPCYYLLKIISKRLATLFFRESEEKQKPSPGGGRWLMRSIRRMRGRPTAFLHHQKIKGALQKKLQRALFFIATTESCRAGNAQ